MEKSQKPTELQFFEPKPMSITPMACHRLKQEHSYNYLYL